jgi:hypothetical protein
MKMTRVVGVTTLALTGAGVLWAATLQSGIPVGKSMPKYAATKCGGGNDGIAVGKSLCYT